MPHDKNGNELKVGDKVTIHAEVTVVSETPDYCNLTVETTEGRKPDGKKETVTLNAATVEKCCVAVLAVFALAFGSARADEPRYVVTNHADRVASAYSVTNHCTAKADMSGVRHSVYKGCAACNCPCNDPSSANGTGPWCTCAGNCQCADCPGKTWSSSAYLAAYEVKNAAKSRAPDLTPLAPVATVYPLYQSVQSPPPLYQYGPPRATRGTRTIRSGTTTCTVGN